MKEVFTRTMEHIASTAYMVNAKTALLDLERKKQPITIHTFTRRYIDKYKCVDIENKPITLDNFVIHGELIYYKKNQFEWKTISMDEVNAIYA